MKKNEVAPAVRYTEAHPMEDLSLAMLAQKSGLPADQFSRVFHKQMGI